MIESKVMENDTPRSMGYGSPRDDRFFTPRSIGRENSSNSDEWQTPRYETPRFGEYTPRVGSDNEFQTPRMYDPSSLPNSARARGNSSSSIVASNYYHTHHQRNDSYHSQHDDKGYPGYYSARSGTNPSPRLSDTYYQQQQQQSYSSNSHYNSEPKSNVRTSHDADSYYSARLPQQVFEDKHSSTNNIAYNQAKGTSDDYDVDNLAESLETMGVSEQDVEDIFSFARHGRSEEIERLLSKGLPVDVRDNYGNTILVIACQNGNKRVAKAVLRRGANINARNHKGNTPLHYCYHYGYGETLGQYMIEKGADVNARNNAGKLAYQGI